MARVLVSSVQETSMILQGVVAFQVYLPTHHRF